MCKLFVLADDLTGALDTAIQFAIRDISTRVISDNPKAIRKFSGTCTVLVMNLPTRHMNAQAAAAAVSAAVEQALACGIPYLFKKTDSVLRGNVGAELTAMLDAANGKRLDFFPAFPTLERTTHNGIQRLRGTPIHETDFRNDPFEPVTESSVPAVIARQSAVACRVIRQGDEPLDLPPRCICVYDADTCAELTAAVRSAHENGGLRLMAGCAGLAGAVSEILGLSSAPTEDFPPYRALLTICGSVNPITGQQMDFAAAHGFLRLTLSPAQRTDTSHLSDSLLASLISACRAGTPVIIDVFSGADVPMASQREAIAQTLGLLTATLWRRNLRATILATGGDTLLSVLNALDCRSIRPVCELQPGVVYSECLCGEERIPVISKAGSFGGETLLTDIAAWLTKRGI